MGGRVAMKINQKGSLLLESLLSIVIVSVSLVVITQSLLSSLRAIKKSSAYLVAMTAMENKMDALIYQCLRRQPLKEIVSSPSEEPYQYSLEEQTIDTDEKNTAILKEVKLMSSWGESREDNQISLKIYLLDFANAK